MTSDTPLTDQERKHWISGSDGMMAVRIEFARDIERKLNEANDSLASLAHVIAGKCPKHGTVTVFGHLKRTSCDEWHCPACEEIAALKTEHKQRCWYLESVIEKIAAERDDLRERLAEILAP